MQLDTLHTAIQIDASRRPGRLERTRRAREATPTTLQHSRLRRQVGMLLSQAGARLQAMPAETSARERAAATPRQAPV